MNLMQLIEQFPDDESCRQHLIKVRWREGVTCPRCGCGRVSELKSRKQWTCLDCRYRFSATAGTIFHNSKIGLRKWFIAIFIVLNAKKGISSLELNRQLNISQECCWHMLHRIREAMREDHADLFRGVVQADEYYHGGELRPEERTTQKKQKKTGRGTGKQPILGIYETESGTIRTQVINNIKSQTLLKAMSDDVDFANSELHTDELRSYRPVGRVFSGHRVVCHSDWYVAKDGTHTNGVENAWSLFARAVMGSFHSISKKHLQRYLDEFDSRFNSRRDDSGEFFNRILRQADGRYLPQKTLCG